jgi:hypothetical protein
MHNIKNSIDLLMGSSKLEVKLEFASIRNDVVESMSGQWSGGLGFEVFPENRIV